MATAASTPAASAGAPQKRDGPVALIVVGMAGSGKTTLTQRLASHLSAEFSGRPESCYCVNLDPACARVPFGANVDIRDTVSYKDVMREYGLGPNGAIMTSLNLFATRFDQVVGFVEKRVKDPESPLRYVLLDTPGQIEAFTWSASGTIVTEALASCLPTVILYVVDVPRSAANPSTFMANMLYACSVLYKSRLPIVLALTKTDVVSGDVVLSWMRDFDSFEKALRADPSFAHDLAHSMALSLEEFYRGLRAVGVSAVTGQGVRELFAAVDEAAEEYWKEYVPEVEARKKQREEEEAARQKEQLAKLSADMTPSQKPSTK